MAKVKIEAKSVERKDCRISSKCYSFKPLHHDLKSKLKNAHDNKNDKLNRLHSDV